MNLSQHKYRLYMYLLSNNQIALNKFDPDELELQ